jgi:hypothetical protein
MSAPAQVILDENTLTELVSQVVSRVFTQFLQELGTGMSSCGNPQQSASLITASPGICNNLGAATELAVDYLHPAERAHLAHLEWSIKRLESFEPFMYSLPIADEFQAMLHQMRHIRRRLLIAAKYGHQVAHDLHQHYCSQHLHGDMYDSQDLDVECLNRVLRQQYFQRVEQAIIASQQAPKRSRPRSHKPRRRTQHRNATTAEHLSLAADRRSPQ